MSVMRVPPTAIALKAMKKEADVRHGTGILFSPPCRD
jgi:hypothetical protein